MRLRLEIVRNRLPPTKVLWQVESEQTTAELLKSLDAIVPLESESWDLEDYVLETTDGFEALHYQTLGSILKDDDHVKIRPLGSRDIRARRVSGRTQIHPSGAHLLDGVVYGRSFSYHVKRPQVHIAPREKLENGGTARYDSSSQSLVLFDQGNLDDEGEAPSDAEEADRDMVLDGDTDDSWVGSSASFSDHAPDFGDRQDLSEEGAESTDEMEDEEVIPVGTIITVQGTKRPRSPNESSLEAPKHRNANYSTPENAPPRKRNRVAELTSPRHDSDPKHTVAPGHGRKKTKARNKRRALAAKLRHFKDRGLLPVDANTEDLVGLLDGRFSMQQGVREPNSTLQATGVKAGSSIVTSSHPDITSEPTSSSSGSDSESLESSSDSSDSESDSSDSDSSSDSSEVSIEDADHETSARSPTVFLKPSKNDKSSAQTMVSVSLSDEAPSIEASNRVSPQSAAFEARRRRLLDQLASGGIDVTTLEDDLARTSSDGNIAEQSVVKKKASNKSAEVSGNGIRTVDPLYWKSKIELTAVECSGQGRELSTPPFPFFQRWDPSQWNQNRKEKRQQRNYDRHDDDQDLYNEDGYEKGDSSYLNYDDVDEDGAADYVHDEHEINGFAKGPHIDNDLPEPPEDLTSLPIVRFEDLASNDVIIFRNLEVSAATQWSPSMSEPRVAKLRNDTLSDRATQLELQLAKRHFPSKKYDEHGKRIFDKFETPIEHDEDEGILYLTYDQLVEPRCIVKGENRQPEEAVL